MSLSRVAFRFRRVLFALVGVAMVYGAVSYGTLPAREDPKITVRDAVITTRFPGLPVEKVDLLITKTLEEKLREISELEEIRSVSLPGRSVIHTEVRDRFFDLDQIWDEVRDKVDEARADLPEGTLKPEINDDFGDVAVITAALTADDVSMGRMRDMAQHIRDRLYGVPGTRRIDLLGIQEERIFIEFSNARLARLGVSPAQLASALQDQNIISPGGQVDAAGQEFILEPTGNFDSAEAIGDTLVALPDQDQTIAIRDLATVRRGTVDPPRRTAYFNGKPAILFAISMNDTDDVLSFSPRMSAAMDAVRRDLPAGYSLDIATYQATQVKQAVQGVSLNVAQTLLIVLAVVVFFLGLRTGLIVGTIVPAVMLVTLAVMNMAGMTLERMSLATLVIALGLLVDNGIVMAEDFKRRLDDGESRMRALIESGRTLALPLLSSSLTTMLVFLPLMLADHVSGEYTRSISVVIVITLMASWFLALTVTPVLCYYFIRSAEVRQAASRSGKRGFTLFAAFERVNRGYERLLCAILRHRALFLSVVVAAFVVAVYGMSHVPRKFFPDSDRAQILVYLDLPAGTSMRKTDQTVRAMTEFLADDALFPHVDDIAGYGGFGGPRFVLSLTPIDPADNKGFLVLNVDRYANVVPTIDTLRAGLNDHFPEARPRVTKMFLGPSDSSKIQVQIKGPDADYLFQTAKRLEDVLRSVPGSLDVRTDWENRITRLKVTVDQHRARRSGVTSADIARSLRRYFSGVQISEFRTGDDIFPIMVRAKADERFDLDRVESVSVAADGSSEGVPLVQVADVSLVTGFGRIERENLFRTITVEAKNTRMTAEDVAPLIEDALAALRADLPPGHAIEYDGVIEQSAEAQAALSANVPLVAGVILLLLIAQFNSYRRALIIVLTIPLILIGAVLGMLVMNVNFGFMVSLGLYALAGIIINNAIVLIDRIDMERRADDGRSAVDAIISASVRRLRPIVMTTVTTILGLLPLIIGRDALFYGMASAIAFGLAVGTILTLGVVPALYSLLMRVPGPVRPVLSSPRKPS
ncbi:efflux RND transporter permease subunit [Yunchengibacter salinarum]|uniref:efflux RND transporter permease subunit n=1 Tax=Yunchengibacter salinarum TaxID=3133399 RepID=UPI0035B63801